MTVGRQDPFRNFNFLVEIENIVQTGFSQVILPAAWADVIEYREGGDQTARKLQGRVHFGNLILTWGITGSLELYKWWKAIQDGHTDRRRISVILLDGDRNPVRRWLFQNAWPVRYQPSVLDGRGHEVVMETLEIAHEGLEVE